jgi:hypothetical protein
MACAICCLQRHAAWYNSCQVRELRPAEGLPSGVRTGGRACVPAEGPLNEGPTHPYEGPTRTLPSLPRGEGDYRVAFGLRRSCLARRRPTNATGSTAVPDAVKVDDREEAMHRAWRDDDDRA